MYGSRMHHYKIGCAARMQALPRALDLRSTFVAPYRPEVELHTRYNHMQQNISVRREQDTNTLPSDLYICSHAYELVARSILLSIMTPF
jgi:hypothetical protein